MTENTDHPDLERFLDLTMFRHDVLKKNDHPTAIDIDEKELRELYRDLLRRPWKDFPLRGSIEAEKVSLLIKLGLAATKPAKELAELIINNMFLTCLVPKGYDTKGYDPSTFRTIVPGQVKTFTDKITINGENI